jgi:hypothetical protein
VQAVFHYFVARVVTELKTNAEVTKK